MNNRECGRSRDPHAPEVVWQRRTAQPAAVGEGAVAPGDDHHGYIEQARKSPRLNEMFDSFGRLAAGSAGRPHTRPALNPDLVGHDNAVLRYGRVRQDYAGPFNAHFVASVPYVLEEQCRLGSGLLEYCTGMSGAASVYTLGDGPGVTARTLAKVSGGRIRTLNCSPNPENRIEFESNRPDAAHFFEGPFFELTRQRRTEIGGGVFSDCFDVIVEDTTFQMYGKERIEPIDLALRHLKPDGLLILIEKLSQPDAQEFTQRERQKDESFKSRFFSPEAIADKQQEIVASMNSQLATLRELTDAVTVFLRHCVVTWNSGNFYTVAASNCQSQLDRFVRALIPPAVPTGFLYERLPLLISPPAPGEQTAHEYRFRTAKR